MITEQKCSHPNPCGNADDDYVKGLMGGRKGPSFAAPCDPPAPSPGNAIGDNGNSALSHLCPQLYCLKSFRTPRAMALLRSKARHRSHCRAKGLPALALGDAAKALCGKGAPWGATCAALSDPHSAGARGQPNLGGGGLQARQGAGEAMGSVGVARLALLSH